MKKPWEVHGPWDVDRLAREGTPRKVDPLFGTMTDKEVEAGIGRIVDAGGGEEEVADFLFDVWPGTHALARGKLRAIARNAVEAIKEGKT